MNRRVDQRPRPDRQPLAADSDISTHVYLCTGCPLGCRLEVDAVHDDVVEVPGFGCRRGCGSLRPFAAVKWSSPTSSEPGST